MLKKFFIILFASILIIGICQNVFATDTQKTATSTVNGVTAKWEYQLSNSNEIENLKCTNPTELSGNITIPSTLDGKTVVSLGNNAFKSATKITEVTIPNSVKEIELWAFRDCTKLNKVNLGNIEKIGGYAFKGCTSLTSVKIPKTLKNTGLDDPVFPNNLNQITFEDGLTIIPQALCAETEITEVTIPNSVKEIELWAFRDCAKLNKVNLGNIEKIGGYAFKGCTSLTNVKIPKTLKNTGLNDPVFPNNLNQITFEDGLTIIPNALCAKTKVTEVTIPSSVKEIELWAFRDCSLLKKITILDNVENMGGYNTSNSDSIFQNHNKDLTIYCYKDSMAAKYAIKYNIKYVYLTKPVDTKPTENNKKDDEQSLNGDTSTKKIKNINKNDTTVSPIKLPKTGVSIAIVFIIIFTIVVAVIFSKRHSNYKDIK